MSSRAITSWALGCCLLFAFGCAQVLDARERKLDPALMTDAGSPSTACSSYCASIMTNCTGSDAQYVSLPVCLADCSHLPTAAPGATFGNSVQCRQGEATLAATTGEPSEHCSMAGPAGNSVCGTTCESYCSLIMPTCPTAFSSTQACEFACKSMADLKRYDTSEQRGDTVQCRIFHVSAATQSPSSHCPHAGAESTHYCVDSDAGEATPPSCDVPPEADDCDRCERQKCCKEFDDCYSDTICDTADSDLDACIDLAESMDAGTSDCHTRFIATNASAAAFAACLRSNCALECHVPSPAASPAP
ncbi:MAG: hypothetical protein ABUL62_12935 [Myxococcales bacterium]